MLPGQGISALAATLAVSVRNCDLDKFTQFITLRAVVTVNRHYLILSMTNAAIDCGPTLGTVWYLTPW